MQKTNLIMSGQKLRLKLSGEIMRKMKNSGIEWIGEIPAEWGVFPARYAFSEVKVKNTCGEVKNALQFKFGTIIPKSNFDADCEDYVADTITNYTIVEPRTIMINGLNLNYDLKSLRVGLVKEKGVITSAYLALKPDENIINAEFANYLFKGYESKMAFHNMGAGIRLTLGFKEFKNQPILIPEMAEQLKIIGFLDNACAEIDTVIEKTKATIEEYKNLKQSVITQAVTKGIRPNRPMKDSGIEWIGEIPADWETISVKNVATYNDETLGETTNDDYEFDYIEIGSIQHGKGIVQMEHLKFKDAPSRARRIVKENDIIVSTVRTYLKAVAKIDKLNEPTIVSTGFVVIRPITEKIEPLFLNYAILSDTFISKVESCSVGISYPAINSTEVVKFKISLPPKDEQKEIADYLDKKCSEIDELIAKKTSLLSELESYKKSLIYEYVTGKKEVI